MSDVRLPSSTIWLNSAYIEYWLAGLWPGWRVSDVRHAWDGEKRWYWVVPDYDKGRSRVAGISMRLLETTTVSKLQEVLEDHDWLRRIEQEALLVGRGEDGEWTVEAWDPPVDEAWFADPNEAYFVAFKDAGHRVAVGPSPAPLPTPFLALHGKEWSAMGPKDPKDALSYSEAELTPFVLTVGKTPSPLVASSLIHMASGYSASRCKRARRPRESRNSVTSVDTSMASRTRASSPRYIKPDTPHSTDTRLQLRTSPITNASFPKLIS